MPGHRDVRARTLVVVMAVLTAFEICAAPGVSAAPQCTDVEVIFARGTDEPAGIGVVGQALVDTLRPMLKGKSISTYAVKYPASWDFLQAAAGANDMSKRAQATAARCPDTKIVLGGYSQGAAVVDVVATSPVAGLGFSAPLPAAVVPHIASVVVFGNPSARLGQPLTTMSSVFGSRTADLCNTNDPICSTGRDFDAHVRYPQSGLVKMAAQWVTKQIEPKD
jgi:cutinase-like protein